MPTMIPVGPKRLNSTVNIPLASNTGLINIMKTEMAVKPALIVYCVWPNFSIIWLATIKAVSNPSMPKEKLMIRIKLGKAGIYERRTLYRWIQDPVRIKGIIFCIELDNAATTGFCENLFIVGVNEFVSQFINRFISYSFLPYRSACVWCWYNSTASSMSFPPSKLP